VHIKHLDLLQKMRPSTATFFAAGSTPRAACSAGNDYDR